MSTDLQWLLIRKYNSHMVKKVPGGPVFSSELANLRNLHSYKYSGLANKKRIFIRDSPSGIMVTVSKPDVPLRKIPATRATFKIRNRSGGRRALGVVAGLAKRGYRPDLRTAVLARTSAILAAQKEKKPRPPKKVRGKKAKAKSS